MNGSEHSFKSRAHEKGRGLQKSVKSICASRWLQTLSKRTSDGTTLQTLAVMVNKNKCALRLKGCRVEVTFAVP